MNCRDTLTETGEMNGYPGKAGSASPSPILYQEEMSVDQKNNPEKWTETNEKEKIKMHDNMTKGKAVGYEYKNITVARNMESSYTDGYANFGWNLDNRETAIGGGSIDLKFKRDRKIRNKAELSRLQREFDNHIHEIERLESSKTSSAQIASFSVGFIGTALMAGATFAYLGGFLPFMLLLAIPGFIGWILPYFVYNAVRQKRTEKVTAVLEKQYDATYEICEKANGLLAV